MFAAQAVRHQKEAVDGNVEEQCRKDVAWVVVVPQADLHWNDRGSVQQEEAAEEEHHCQRVWSAEDQRMQLVRGLGRSRASPCM